MRDSVEVFNMDVIGVDGNAHFCTERSNKVKLTVLVARIDSPSHSEADQARRLGQGLRRSKAAQQGFEGRFRPVNGLLPSLPPTMANLLDVPMAYQAQQGEMALGGLLELFDNGILDDGFWESLVAGQ